MFLSKNISFNNLDIHVLKDFPEANKLIFPNDPIIYKFKEDDLEHRANIYAHPQSYVQHWFHRPSKNHLAIKFIRFHIERNQVPDARYLKQLQNELQAHIRVKSCQNIVKLYGFCVNNGHLMICMELMNISLSEFYTVLHKKEIKITEEVLWKVIISVLSVLKTCKENYVMHRDIKPLNILLNDRGEIKLCDFGVSRVLDDSNASSYTGTWIYMDPDLFNPDLSNAKHDFRAEIWSLGITIVEIILGRHPNSNKAVRLQSEIDLICLEPYSEDLKIFITKCFQPFGLRPSLDEIFKDIYQKYSTKEVTNEYYDIVNKAIDIVHQKNQEKKEIEKGDLVERLKNIQLANKLCFLGDPQIYDFELNDFEQVNRIYYFHGNELYGKSFINFHKPSRQDVAIKSRDLHSPSYLSSDSWSKSIENEIETLRKMSFHRNFLNFYGFYVSDTHILICLELMDINLRTFYEWLHEKNIQIKEDFLWIIIVSLLNGLKGLKENKIIHRNITPSTILLNIKGDIKLSGFDLSCFMGDNIDYEIKIVGSLIYVAPERLFKENYEFKSDIWSIGIIINEIFLGRHPYSEEFPSNPIIKQKLFRSMLLLKEMKNVLDLSILNSSYISDDLKQLVSSILKLADERPSIEEIISSSTYQKYAVKRPTKEYYDVVRQAITSLETERENLTKIVNS